ncbi:hypothetical protein CSC14_3395 [Proteus mirabilis]|nr:hypothetical protein CSC14_3395 [Proteus mirabilis]
MYAILSIHPYKIYLRFQFNLYKNYLIDMNKNRFNHII